MQESPTPRKTCSNELHIIVLLLYILLHILTYFTGSEKSLETFVGYQLDSAKRPYINLVQLNFYK